MQGSNKKTTKSMQYSACEQLEVEQYEALSQIDLELCKISPSTFYLHRPVENGFMMMDILLSFSKVLTKKSGGIYFDRNKLKDLIKSVRDIYLNRQF